MTYHLRQAGKLETVSRETATSPPAPPVISEMPTGETAAAVVSR